MTFEEALAQLGLTDAASAEDAKRAYHKLLRAHNPEVDRDGFIALREAYECAMREVLNALITRLHT